MATFHTGVSGKAMVGATDVPVTDWSLTLTARLAETTNSASGGVATWQKVLEEGSGTFNAPWDSTQVPDTDVDLGPGDTGTLKLYCGDSTKFFSFSFIVESLTTVVNTQNDIVRYTVAFKSNGVITHPLT